MIKLFNVQYKYIFVLYVKQFYHISVAMNVITFFFAIRLNFEMVFDTSGVKRWIFEIGSYGPAIKVNLAEHVIHCW